MFYLTMGQIMSVYAYAFSVDLLESLLVLAIVLFLDLTIFLVLKNMEEFQARSILVVLGVLVSSALRILLFPDYENIHQFLDGELIWWAVTLPFGILFAVTASKIKIARRTLDSAAERAIIFLYIYLPLSFISLAVVFIRNIS